MILSIIIPVYNVEKYVEQCIRSCADQDIPSSEYEIICINDGSKDNSLEVVNKVAADYSNVRVISQPNGGLSAARNTGMREAQGDYYMFVDSDDWIEENCLGKLTSRLKKDRPDCLAICGANIYVDGIKRRRLFPHENSVSGPEYMLIGAQDGAPFSIWSADLFKRNHLEFYKGIYHEDSELTPRAHYMAKKVCLTNDIIYYVRQNPNSITRTHNPKRAIDLVSVVCPSLYRFAVSVGEEYKTCYYNRIGILLNNALDEICYAEKSTQIEFYWQVDKNRLWTALSRSSITKYRIEALLAKLLKNRMIKIYRLLSKLSH